MLNNNVLLHLNNDELSSKWMNEGTSQQANLPPALPQRRKWNFASTYTHCYMYINKYAHATIAEVAELSGWVGRVATGD